MEICPKTLICVNLLDEAKRKNIHIDLGKLEKCLGVPVVGTSAHKKSSLKKITDKLDELCGGKIIPEPRQLRYIKPIEQAVSIVEPIMKKHLGNVISEVSEAVESAKSLLAENGITSDCLKDRIVSCILLNAEEVCDECACCEGCRMAFSRADKILTSRAFGYPIMLLMLLMIFWITIVGANYPSELLSTALFWLGDRLSELITYLKAPEWLNGLLIDGAYRVLAWVVAVMQPPMAIFFPMFTLLEDLGYLPRVAYNLDKPFCKCKACGKQSLTMCIDTISL